MNAAGRLQRIHRAPVFRECALRRINRLFVPPRWRCLVQVMIDPAETGHRAGKGLELTFVSAISTLPLPFD
jgi:hypothetical protein